MDKIAFIENNETLDMFHNSNLTILIACILFQTIQNQVLLDFKLFIISNNLKPSNFPCKINDCVPKYHICLSSGITETCDIFEIKKKVFNNKSKSQDVLNRKFDIPIFPKSFKINVTLVGENKTESKAISTFMISVQPVVNEVNLGFLKPSKYLKNIQFQYSLAFQCQTNFYGPLCEKVCIKNSTEPFCILDKCTRQCINGVCTLDQSRTNAHCNCQKGWQGKWCTKNIINCDSDFCKSSKKICSGNQCICTSNESEDELKCFKATENRRKIIHALTKFDYVSVLSISVIVIACIGLIGFIIVNIWRCRYFRARNSTHFYENDKDENMDMSVIFDGGSTDELNMDKETEINCRDDTSDYIGSATIVTDGYSTEDINMNKEEEPNSLE